MTFIRRLVLAAMAALVAVNPVALADTKINQVPTVGNINPTDSLMIMRPDVSAPGGTALKQVPFSLLFSGLGGSSSSAAQKGTAPPTTGTWKLGDTVINSAPTTNGPIGWVNVTPGTPGVWAPYGVIGAALQTPAPAQYTISLLSPTDGSTVTGIVSLSIQAPGLKNVELWNASKTKLAGGVPGTDATGALSISYDSNNLPNGPNSLSLNGWDVPVWTNGGSPPDQQPAHSAALPFTLNVANNSSSTPALTSVSVMTIGDSITAGQGGSGISYRQRLKDKLASSGITLSYVGSQTDGTYAHEGYPGKGVDDIKGYINSNNILALNPNIVILEIGTNDNSGYSGALNSSTYSVFNSGTQALLTEYGTLVDLVHTRLPNAYILVSNLLPRTGGMAVPEDAFNKGPVTGFASGIASVVSSRFNASTYKIYLVDNNTNFPSSTGLADGLHPNDSVGYPYMGDQIASVALTALHSSGTGSTSPPSSSVTAPSYAVAAGFSSLVYDVESWSSSVIDTNNTRQTGFKLYRDRPFGMGALGTNNYTINGDGTLTITGDGAGPNFSLNTTASNGSGSWNGFTILGGGYIEGKFRLRGTGTGSGWNSFWLMDAEHLWQNTAHGGEMDIFEYFQQAFSWNNSWIGFTIHDHHWDSSSDSQNDPVVDLGSTHDYTAWHTYGMLWKAATSTSQGSATFYVDGTARKTVTWSQGATYSINDTVHQAIILGTGGTAQMDIGYLRVFH